MNFITTLLEQYKLMESLDSVIKSNPAIPEQTIRTYHQHSLPDGNKSDKLLSHVLKLHKAGEITPDRAAELKPHLTALHLSNQLNKISSLKTLDDHKNATVGMNTDTKKERIITNTPTIYDTDDILVKQHLNHESAIKGAALHPKNPVRNRTNEPGKASWCVSVDDTQGKEHFDKYTEKGTHPLYTIHNKKTKRTTAFVADPERTYLEIRDERDELKSPYHLIVNNPGVEKSKPGRFLLNHDPKLEDLIRRIPHYASADDLHKILAGKSASDKVAVFSHPNHNQTHIDAIMADKSKSSIPAKRNAIHSEHVTSDHIYNAINDDPLVSNEAMKHRNVTSDHIDKILDTDHEDSIITALHHENLSPDNINKAFAYRGENEMGAYAIQHPNANVDNLTKALDSEERAAGGMAMNHPKINSGHIDQALSHWDEEVRSDAIGHPLTTKKQLLAARKNEDDDMNIEQIDKRLKNMK